MPLTARNPLTLAALIAPAVVAVVYFVLALATKLRGAPRWDDHFGVGTAWLLVGVAAAIVLRLVWALVAPERYLPRWLAILMLVLMAGAVGFVFLQGAIADAMAGF